MPYKSRAQEKWAHTPEGVKALGGDSAVKEWDAASKGKTLPERVTKKKSKPKVNSNLREADFRQRMRAK